LFVEFNFVDGFETDVPAIKKNKMLTQRFSKKFNFYKKWIWK